MNAELVQEALDKLFASHDDVDCLKIYTDGSCELVSYDGASLEDFFNIGELVRHIEDLPESDSFDSWWEDNREDFDYLTKSQAREVWEAAQSR